MIKQNPTDLEKALEARPPRAHQGPRSVAAMIAAAAPTSALPWFRWQRDFGRWRAEPVEQIGIWVLVLVIHMGLAMWFTVPGAAPPAAALLPMRVDWIVATPAEAIPPPSLPRQRPKVSQPPPRATAVQRAPAPPPIALRPSSAVVANDVPRKVEPSSQPRLQLFRRDGSVYVPTDLAVDPTAIDPASKTFSFAVPGLAQTKFARRRPPALSYEPTRFDDSFRPTQDVLSDVLTRAVEASTVTIRIPIAGGYIVCKLGVLALGGGCGIVSNDGGYFVAEDDPATLDDEEFAQCEAWRQRLIEGTEQSAWLRTRALYDAECRKPRAAPLAG